MTSSENKDTATQLAKRISKSKEVNIVFTDSFSFDVLDENKNVKYSGKVSDDKTEDECKCPSWKYGMRFDDLIEKNDMKGESRYVAENGFNFQCKHLIEARAIQYGENAE